MHRLFQLAFRFILVLCLVTTAVAQENSPAKEQRKGPTVTAFASSERVRFTAPSSVVQIRLEVYNSAGKKVFDNEVRGGNVLDWHLEDGQGEHLADDSYLGVVTVKSLSGKISQRIGSVTVEKNAATVQDIDVSQMTAQQSEAIGPVEGDGSLIVLKEGERQTGTVIAHNGEEGQITRGRGALSFRLGDFFSGKDQEQMRLTSEGNLGIGITNPQVRLDVDGVIRTSEGILFPDGTIQYSAASKTKGAKSSGSGAKSGGGQDFQAQATGTGTQNRIAKWLDNVGTLGDSVIAELNGNIGIGTASPTRKLELSGTGNVGVKITDTSIGNAAFLLYTRNSNGTLAGRQFSIFDENALADRFVINSSGNVGIGTVNPLRTLQLGPSPDALFTLSATDGSPNAGYIRFGDQTGWKLHIGRNRESSAGPLNSGTAGALMTIQDNGNIGIGTTTPQSKLDVRGDVKLGAQGQFFAVSSEENLRIIRGVVDSDGTILVGSGFSVIRSGVRYVITFDVPFSGAPAVTAAAEFDAGNDNKLFAMTDGAGLNTAQIILFEPDVSGVPGDGGQTVSTTGRFRFMAIGPR